MSLARLGVRCAHRRRTLLRAKLLRANIQKALVSSTQSRTLAVPVNTVKPKVTGDKLAKKYPTILTVDRSGFRISLFKHLKRVKVYPIAVGQAGLETPAGLYKIQNTRRGTSRCPPGPAASRAR